MKADNQSNPGDKRLVWQLILATLLVAFPVIMIVVNGSKAIQGILWDQGIAADYPAAGSGQVPTTANAGFSEGSHPFFGIYDPEKQFRNDTLIDAEHIYFSWLEFNDSLLVEKLMEIGSRGRTPIITIEPWTKNDPDQLMSGIIAGHYDNEINRIGRCLNRLKSPMRISWGHEMDQDLTRRYSWSGVNPKEFISAYRYFVDKMKMAVDQEIQWIWAPVGKRDCERYWPGNEYVDAVGVPVYSFPAWDRKTYGFIRSFPVCFNEKYSIIAQFRKPVIIMEMGVTGSEDFCSFWMHDAFMNFPKYPLEGIVFFYSADTPGAWGADVPTPDWRSSRSTILSLIEWSRQDAPVQRHN